MRFHREPDGRLLDDDPVGFYQSHRKGWSILIEQWSIELLDGFHRQRARYFATWRVRGLELSADFRSARQERHTQVEWTANWGIYRLGERNDDGP